MVTRTKKRQAGRNAVIVVGPQTTLPGWIKVKTSDKEKGKYRDTVQVIWFSDGSSDGNEADSWFPEFSCLVKELIRNDCCRDIPSETKSQLAHFPPYGLNILFS